MNRCKKDKNIYLVQIILEGQNSCIYFGVNFELTWLAKG